MSGRAFANFIGDLQETSRALVQSVVKHLKFKKLHANKLNFSIFTSYTLTSEQP